MTFSTPLTTIIGYLALLHENDDLPTSTRQRYIASAYEKSERLEGLINDSSKSLVTIFKLSPLNERLLMFRFFASK